MGTVAIHYERDGVWIEDPEGDEWLYEPGLFGSALWAEYGVIYEQEEIALLAALLPEEGVIVDVGANIGLHSIKLAKRVKSIRVHAFEPVSSTMAALRRNIRRNHADERIAPHHMAISDQDGELRLTAGFSPGNFVIPNGAGVASAGLETVKARRLDSILPELGASRVDLIKCDVEGHELAVLGGATETLHRHRPRVFVEIMDRHARRYGHSTHEVFELLANHGYSYCPVVEGRLQAASGFPSSDLTKTTNFLFAPTG